MIIKCDECLEEFDYDPNPSEDINEIKEDKERIFICGECQ